MSKVIKIKIADTEFKIACENSEEDKARRLASQLDRRIALLAQSFTNSNLISLLVINGLMMEEELNELKEQKFVNSDSQAQEFNGAIDQALEEITHYIQDITTKIKALD